jgi:hypothetical protein
MDPKQIFYEIILWRIGVSWLHLGIPKLKLGIICFPPLPPKDTHWYFYLGFWGVHEPKNIYLFT